MRNKYEYNLENRVIQDLAYDLLGEMILDRETATYLKETEKMMESGDTVITEFFVQQDKKNLTRIANYLRRQRRKRFVIHTLPQIGKVAAIVIATITMAGSVAIATSQTVRVQVMKLLLALEEQYTHLELIEDSKRSFDIPEEWSGSSYMAYVPADLVMTSINCFPDLNVVQYANRNTNTIQLSFVEGSAGTANLDTENATVTEIVLNGYTTYVSEKENDIIVFWSDGQVYFVLTATDIIQEEVIRIAESVMRIK